MSLFSRPRSKLTVQLNMKVGKKLAAGIETGQETAASAKETVGMSFFLSPSSFVSPVLTFPSPYQDKNVANRQLRTSHQPERSRERQRKLGNPPTRV